MSDVSPNEAQARLEAGTLDDWAEEDAIPAGIVSETGWVPRNVADEVARQLSTEVWDRPAWRPK